MLQDKTPLSDKTKELMERAYRKAIEDESKQTDDKKRIRRAARNAASEVGIRRQKEISRDLDDWIKELDSRISLE